MKNHVPTGKLLICASLLWLGAEAAFPQVPDGFNPAPNGPVYALALQPDSKVLVGGTFTNICGVVCNRIARLNPDGTLDLAFSSGADRYVYALAVQPDGKILVGGGFTNLAGKPRSYLGRLNEDGSLDTSFNPPVNGDVTSIIPLPSGQILAAGFFRAGDQWTWRSCIARFFANGALDGTFDAGSVAYPIYSMAIQPDGKVLIGGTFDTLGNQLHNGVGRLGTNGAVDNTFTAWFKGNVWSLASLPDTSILAVGSFSDVCGEYSHNIAKLTADGTIKQAYGTNATSGGPLRTLAVQADGKALVGGSFADLMSQACTNLGRTTTSDTLDQSFLPVVAGPIYSLLIDPQGRILVGGAFTNAVGLERTNLERLGNTDSITQSLSAEGPTIRWLRGGTSPDAYRTTFESSVDGVNWTNLGQGTRIPMGWELNNVSLPSNAALRARAYVSGGFFNGSSSLVQCVRPALVPDACSSNSFGFNVVGSLGQTVVVEFSQNLSDWYPLLTNVLSSGMVHVTDPDSHSFSSRFFRARAE